MTWYKYVLITVLCLTLLFVVIDNIKIKKTGMRLRKELSLTLAINVLLLIGALSYIISLLFSLSLREWLICILLIFIASLNVIVYIHFMELRKLIKEVKNINNDKKDESDKVIEINKKIIEYETNNEH